MNRNTWQWPNINEYNVSFKMGSSMQVIGPTYSGKTYFIIRLIDYCKTVFDKLPQHVYWFYGGKTKIHDKLASRKYKMHEGLPKNGFDFVKENSIIVLDDLMTDSKNDANVTKLFTQLAHHKKLFIINVKQNLYNQSREARDRTLNKIGRASCRERV